MFRFLGSTPRLRPQRKDVVTLPEMDSLHAVLAEMLHDVQTIVDVSCPAIAPAFAKIIHPLKLAWDRPRRNKDWQRISFELPCCRGLHLLSTLPAGLRNYGQLKMRRAQVSKNSYRDDSFKGYRAVYGELLILAHLRWLWAVTRQPLSM